MPRAPGRSDSTGTRRSGRTSRCASCAAWDFPETLVDSVEFLVRYHMMPPGAEDPALVPHRPDPRLPAFSRCCSSSTAPMPPPPTRTRRATTRRAGSTRRGRGTGEIRSSWRSSAASGRAPAPGTRQNQAKVSSRNRESSGKRPSRRAARRLGSARQRASRSGISGDDPCRILHDLGELAGVRGGKHDDLLCAPTAASGRRDGRAPRRTPRRCGDPPAARARRGSAASSPWSARRSPSGPRCGTPSPSSRR